MGHRRLLGVGGAALVAALAGGAAVMHGPAADAVLATVIIGPAGPAPGAMMSPAPGAIAVDERGGRVFVTSPLGFSISVLDAHSGRLLRTVAVGGEPGAVVVDTRTRRAFALVGHPNGTGEVDVLDAGSDQVVQTIPLSSSTGVMAVDERAGRVFLASSADDSLSTFDASSGRLLRTTHVGYDPARGYDPQALAVDERSGHVFTANNSDNSVSMFEARSGRLLRMVSVQQPALLALDEPAARLYVAGHSLSVLDANSGRILRASAGLPIDVLVANERTGRLFGITYDRASMLDGRSGAVLRSVALGEGPRNGYWYLYGSATAAVDGHTGEVFAVKGSISNWDRTLTAGTVYVLDGHTGQILRTIPVGVNPGQIALDGATGRAFVVNAGGTVPATDSWSWLPAWLRDRLPFIPHAPSSPRTVPASVSVLDATR